MQAFIEVALTPWVLPSAGKLLFCSRINFHISLWRFGGFSSVFWWSGHRTSQEFPFNPLSLPHGFLAALFHCGDASLYRIKTHFTRCETCKKKKKIQRSWTLVWPVTLYFKLDRFSRGAHWAAKTICSWTTPAVEMGCSRDAFSRQSWLGLLCSASEYRCCVCIFWLISSAKRKTTSSVMTCSKNMLGIYSFDLSKRHSHRLNLLSDIKL